MQPLSSRDPATIADYTLISRLGSGGMGVVYLATKKSINYALKLIRESLSDDPNYNARFDAEIRTLQSINHPAVARIIEAGHDEGRSWYSSEFVNGPTLEDYVTSHGPLDDDTWENVAKGLLDALRAVHDLDIIHRDIKPSNILLSESGPKIIDFGVARMADATSLTETGSTPGSPAWFSPEQIEGHELGPGTDYFSAASTLTFAATGETPWGAKTGINYASVMKVLVKPPQLDGLSPRQRSIVEPLLEKDPAVRVGLVPQVLELVGSYEPSNKPIVVPDGTSHQSAQRDAPSPPDSPKSVRAEEPELVTTPNPPPPASRPTGGLRSWLGFPPADPSKESRKRTLIAAGVAAGLLAVPIAVLTWGMGPSSLVPGSPAPLTVQFQDGTLEVGSDLAPDTYRSEGGESCYWSRLAVSRGGDETTIEAGYTRIVEILSTDDLFLSAGCGTWVPLSSSFPDSPAAEFSDGTYMVSRHIEPGLYRATDAEWCSWEFRTGFTGDFDEYVRGDRHTIVHILPTDTAFHSDGCGVWQPLERTIPTTPANGFSDGTWLVGEDITAGIYWAPGGEFCRISRLSGFSGDWDDSISFGYYNIIDIRPTDAGVHSSDCGEWVPLSDTAPDEPATSFGDGSFAVGLHIEPGMYSGSAVGVWCRWERLSDFSADYDAVVGSGDSPLVEILASDAGFQTSDCGIWQKISD